MRASSDQLGIVGAGHVPPATRGGVRIDVATMADNNEYPKRKPIRLTYYDYRRTGVYFVTICTHNKRLTLGDLKNGVFIPSPVGSLAEECWSLIPEHSTGVELDQFVLMPNHIHGLVAIESASDPSARRRQPGELRARSLGSVIGSFKAAVTREGRLTGVVGNEPVWQRGFWEHIVRDARALGRIRLYIADNPSRWRFDRENRDRSARDPFDDWITEQGVVSPARR